MTAAILSEAEWSFDQVEIEEPERAAKLKAARDPNALIQALGSALAQGFDRDGVRFVHERNNSHANDWRSVLQFRVGTCVFDWFFNARTGYRAHFKKSPEAGLEFNDAIVKMAVDTIRANAPHILDVTLVTILDEKWQYIGTSEKDREQFLSSFAPNLSKIWLCAWLVAPGQIKPLPFGGTGPKIRVSPSDDRWVAFYQNLDADAWLELKGAFCGTCGLYQPKDPLSRANTIHKKGLA